MAIKLEAVDDYSPVNQHPTEQEDTGVGGQGIRITLDDGTIIMCWFSEWGGVQVFAPGAPIREAQAAYVGTGPLDAQAFETLCDTSHTCPGCSGTGKVIVIGATWGATCPNCNGLGVIE